MDNKLREAFNKKFTKAHYENHLSQFQAIASKSPGFRIAETPASLLAPLRYISVPIGILTGVCFFNEQLSPTFFIGAAIIIISSLIIIKREAKIKLET